MGFLKRFWVWFAGFFRQSPFEEVPILSEEVPLPLGDLPLEPKEKPVPTLPEDFVFRCSDGAHVPPEYYGNAFLLATNLRLLSRELGEPLSLISVYRTPEFNKHIGGRPNSPHLTCLAADFMVVEVDPVDAVNKIKQLVASGKMSAGVVVLNPGFIHYEITEIV